MSWKEVLRIPEKEKKEQQVVKESNQISHFSHFLPPDYTPTDLIEEWRGNLEERAAIREFDGEQERVAAEREAIKEVLPCLKNDSEANLSKEDLATLVDVFRTLLDWERKYGDGKEVKEKPNGSDNC